MRWPLAAGCCGTARGPHLTETGSGVAGAVGRGVIGSVAGVDGVVVVAAVGLPRGVGSPDLLAAGDGDDGDGVSNVAAAAAGTPPPNANPAGRQTASGSAPRPPE